MGLVVVFCVSITLLCYQEVSGHGRLMNPPSRSSAWRKGFASAPVNYDDNSLYCGGFNYQWNTNGGQCGICGDPYDGPRDNEAGGKYAKGIITAKYLKGQQITIEVEITAHHEGWFEFRLCPNNDVNKVATQACLDQYLLEVESQDGSKTTRYDIKNDYRKNYYIKAHLPSGLVCEQCVLQWKYNTGNSWGVDVETGRGCVGCGPQEQFYGCADVRIISQSGMTAGDNTMTKAPATQEYTTTTTEGKSITSPQIPLSTEAVDKTTRRLIQAETTAAVSPKTSSDTDSTAYNTGITTTAEEKEEATTKAPATGSKGCTPSNVWKDISGMTGWCKDNRETCPEPYCTSEEKPAGSSWDSCKGAGVWIGSSHMAKWCQINCSLGYCPKTHCFCP